MTDDPITPFPLQGVIGVVANGLGELDEATKLGLGCVEVRADLLLDNGLSLDDLMDLVKHCGQRQLACLFTLRHPSHGGKFPGTEQERVQISQRALDSGADIIDLEWGSDGANDMLASGVPLIVSHHDFNAMVSPSDLTDLTQRMTKSGARAIKVVPTASTLDDALRMLKWVGEKDADFPDVKRIGFAMGEVGACSRILTLSRGAPITYASFGEAVAPGQVAIEELMQLYRADSLNDATSVTAVCHVGHKAEDLTRQLNEQYQVEGANKIAMVFDASLAQALDNKQANAHSALRIDSILTD